MQAMQLMQTKETVQIRAKWIVVDATSSGGGVRYVRQTTAPVERDGHALQTTSIVVKHVDNEAVVQEIAKLRNKADYTFRTLTTLVGFGFVATDAQLDKLKAAVKDLQQEAERLNKRAKAAGSQHRISVDMLSFRLFSGDAEAVVRSITSTVCVHLNDYKAALLALDLKMIKTVQIRARNLDALMAGRSEQLLKDALECVKTCSGQIRDGVRNGDHTALIRRRLNLTAIDTALAWFGDE